MRPGPQQQAKSSSWCNDSCISSINTSQNSVQRRTLRLHENACSWHLQRCLAQLPSRLRRGARLRPCNAACAISHWPFPRYSPMLCVACCVQKAGQSHPALQGEPWSEVSRHGAEPLLDTVLLIQLGRRPPHFSVHHSDCSHQFNYRTIWPTSRSVPHLPILTRSLAQCRLKTASKARSNPQR